MKSTILIDMSSSMQPRWAETKDAVNGYIKALALTDPDCLVAVYGFSSQDGPLKALTPLRVGTITSLFYPLGIETPFPNGMTPLYDAIGLLDKILSEAGPQRNAVMVVTDGEENVSVQVSGNRAKEIIARWKAREWDVTFLGADFNAFGQAAKLGLGAKDVLNATAGNYAHATQSSAMRTASFAAGVSANNLGFSDEDRRKAEGK